MYSYTWDQETGGLLLNSSPLLLSKEPRPVYYQELDILGFDRVWDYDKDDSAPLMWAENNDYYYYGRKVAQTKGGASFIKPEVVIIDDPEPNNGCLKKVDIKSMVDKNRDLIEKLEADTIKKIYNTFLKYREKVDLFYVAFSGGKDSILVLDLVQRALPHNEFKVLFGDTQMEFPDTYVLVDQIQDSCERSGIEFLRAKSAETPSSTWRQFGPPAQRLRWCCSVHKTTPQILLLREILGNPQFKGMAFTGIRAAESATRATYDDVSLGDKIRGQYSTHPILEWNSAELFLYTYMHELPFNEAYKKGNSRAGCLVCPLAGYKNMFIKEVVYGHNNAHIEHSTTVFNNIILETTAKQFADEDAVKEYMNIAGWKARRSGRELSISRPIYKEVEENGYLTITIPFNNYWREWIKTISRYDFEEANVVNLYIDNIAYSLHALEEGCEIKFSIKIGNNKQEIQLKKALKIALKKSAYCIKCQVCEANCPYGYITMDQDGIRINDKCYKCHKCHDIEDGCLMASSNKLPQNNNKMGSINRYANLGIEFEWVKQYLKAKDSFWENNDLGTNKIKVLKSFLNDSEITVKGKISPFGELIARLDIEEASTWGLIVSNLVYTSQFNWWVKNIIQDVEYTPDSIKDMLSDETKNVQSHVVSAFKNIFGSNEPLSSGLGLGVCVCEIKGDKRYLLSIHRTNWVSPDPRVILYSLYKFAEACDHYYQFSLTDLMNDTIDREGLSPTRIFGIERETMVNILNGLSINYPELISASFTLDLDNITLREDKSAINVLELF